MWPFRKKPDPAPEPSVRERFMNHVGPRPAELVLEFLNDRIQESRPRIGRGLAAGVDAADVPLLSEALALESPTISEALFAWYGAQTFIGYQTAAIIAQHWLINRICLLPARDAVRHGFAVRIEGQADQDSPDLKAIGAANKKFGIMRNMREYVHMGRVFGIRIAIFKVESTDPNYYTKPFNPDGVKPGTYRGIAQVDPYWCAPELDALAAADPASIHFYEPTYWQINGKRYHRSHLAIYRTGDLPDILKPMYLYGGVPVPQRIMERVYGAERTANEAPELVMTKRLDVQKTDLASAIANQAAFGQHLANFIAIRDNFGIKVIDRDDEMTRLDTTLTDLDSLTETQYALACAAGEAPVTKIMGTSPGGMNATGEYDESSYHETLESIQTDDLQPLLERHLLLVCRSELGKNLELQIDWAPLDAPTAKEYAEINKLKAETDAVYVTNGILDPDESRNRLATDPNSDYTGLAGPAPEPEEEPTEELEPDGQTE